MSEELQKKIFAKNLNKYLSLCGKSQKEVADAIGVIPSTFNTWCQGIALPRMGKVQALADYFHIKKTDLIDEHEESPVHATQEFPEDIRAAARGMMELSEADKALAINMIKSLAQKGREAKEN